MIDELINKQVEEFRKEFCFYYLDTPEKYYLNDEIDLEDLEAHLLNSMLKVGEAYEQQWKVDHNIDVRYEPDLLTAFNKFIKKWCGPYYGHLIDTDEQDGQYIREKISSLTDKGE